MHRMLLVEDNPEDRRLFKNAVAQSSKPCELVVADDAEGAFAVLCSGQKLDLVVLDWRLLKGDSRDLLTFLKTSPKRSSTPVVVFSASDYAVDIAVGTSRGAKWFKKPLDLDEYIAVVDGILSLMSDVRS
jgi:DNA-binding response OmpR family regulator